MMIATTITDHQSGESAKLAAHTMLEARREVFINRGRLALLMRLLDAGTATADDVRAAVELPHGIASVCLGAVPGPLARLNIIRRVGFTKTTRPAGHARPVTVWELADRDAAVLWLEDHPDLPDPPPRRHDEDVAGLLDTITKKRPPAATSGYAKGDS